MRNVFIVYKTDNWHSYKSRDIIGVATTVINVVKLCKQKAKKEGSKINDEQLWNLTHIKQTQGYEGEGEFSFEEMELNKLL